LHEFDDIKERLRQAVDLVDLVGERVALKRAGRDLGGLCPFHQEKTPSF
jgi:DNA primase